MQPWQDHNSNTGGYYNCNRYTDKSTNSDEPVEKARAELERYLFYYQRFNNHNQSLRFANTQLAQTEKRMMEMQNEGQTDWIDVQFLKQAVKKVIDCRRTLKYTYVSGFFLENKTKSQQKIKNLFEHHQEMLEKNTESLSGATEKNYTELDRTEVINLTRVTDNLHKELIKCMMEGEDDIASSQLGDNDDDLISPSTSSSSAVPSAVNPNKKSKVRG
jgi:ariadne-1